MTGPGWLLTAVVLIAAGVIVLLWLWLRPRHGRHEAREQAGAREADAFVAALRGREPADEGLADTDVRRRFWPAPASPPAPGAGLGPAGVSGATEQFRGATPQDGVSQPGAGAVSAPHPYCIEHDQPLERCARRPGEAVYGRTLEPLPHVGIVIPPS